MTKYVCHKCVNDCVLSEVILADATSWRCSYCSRRGRNAPIAAELDQLTSYISEVIDRDYTDDLDSEIAWDSEEHSYIEGVLEIWDVLDNLGFQPLSDALLNDVQQHMGGTSYARLGHYPGTPSERAMISWEYFCDTVKHEKRFTFWDDIPDILQYDFSPAEMLQKITESASRNGLVQTIPPGRRFWRVRNHDPRATSLANVEDFTSVPGELALASNRMSPAGVSMFYGADDFMTACREVVGRHHSDKKKSRVTGICFEIVQPLNILDLTSIRRPRSLFEKTNHFAWHEQRFLLEFVQEASRPIDKQSLSGRSHIDYIPTQVFTEVVRYRMQHDGKPLHGLLYPSCYDGSTCVVIFANTAQCLPVSGKRQLLSAIVETIRHVPVSRVSRSMNE